MAFHLRSGNMEAPQCTASSMNSLSAAGNKVSYLKNYATQSSLPCIRTKEKYLTAATTWGSPFSPSPAKFSLGFYSTCWFHPSPKNTSLKLSATSELTEAQRTWCLSSVNCRKSAVSKTWVSIQHLSTWKKRSTQWAGKDYGPQDTNVCVKSFYMNMRLLKDWYI